MVGYFRKNRNFFCRLACIHFFSLEGILAGIWASQLPEIQERSNLSDSTLGLCGLSVYFGTVAATPISGYLIRLLGSKWATILGAFLFICSLPLMGFNVNLTYLIFSMLFFGIGMGIMDVAMNASAVVAELVADKPLMGSFHGSYSIAAAISSLFGTVLTSTGWSPLEIFALTGAIMFIITVILSGGLYSSKEEAYYSSIHWKLQLNQQKKFDPVITPLLVDDALFIQEQEEQEEREREKQLQHEQDYEKQKEVERIHSQSQDEDNKQRLEGLNSSQTTDLIALCLVGFLGSYGEGAMVTWSVIYYERYIHIPSSLRSMGFFTFMVCMAFGRFSCDYIRKKFGRRKIIRVSGLFASIGVCLLILAPSFQQGTFEILLSELGVILTGTGLATIVPTVFSSAGHLPNTHAGSSIATVAAFTYCGSIVAPPLVGGISQGLDSLRLAFIFIGAFLGLMFPLSFFVPKELNSHPTRKLRGKIDSNKIIKEKEEEYERDNYEASPLISDDSSNHR